MGQTIQLTNGLVPSN